MELHLPQPNMGPSYHIIVLGLCSTRYRFDTIIPIETNLSRGSIIGHHNLYTAAVLLLNEQNGS